MNLHEQCLLRYLQDPDELTSATEALLQNNSMLEEQFIVNLVAKYSHISYNR